MELPKYLLLDVDGTIWKVGKALPGIPEAIAAIKQMGIKVKILTNNTSMIRKDFAHKIVLCGVNDIKEKDIFSSSYGCALLMKRNNIKTAYVSGFSGLKEEIRLQGITVYEHSSPIQFPVVDAIAVANPKDYNFKHFSRMATIWKRSPNCKLFGANPDMNTIAHGKTILGSGSIVSLTERMFNTKAINVGKPSEELISILLEKLKCKPQEMMIVGDRLPTDIAFGAKYGLSTVFVLTGVDKATNIDELPPELRPCFILPSLANLPDLFKKRFKPLIRKAPSIRDMKKVIKTPKITASKQSQASTIKRKTKRTKSFQKSPKITTPSTIK